MQLKGGKPMEMIPNFDIQGELSQVNKEELNQQACMSPSEARSLFRQGKWTKPNMHFCLDYAVMHLAIVPKDFAYEYLLFCVRNPRPLPVLEVTEPGDPHPGLFAPRPPATGSPFNSG